MLHRKAEKLDRIWAALQIAAAPLSIADLARISGADPRYVSKRLNTYTSACIITKTEDGRFLANENTPDQPPILGSDGRMESREPAMTPQEFAYIFRQSGLSMTAFARELGWKGKQQTVSRAISRLLKGQTVVDKSLADKIKSVFVSDNKAP